MHVACSTATLSRLEGIYSELVSQPFGKRIVQWLPCITVVQPVGIQKSSVIIKIENTGNKGQQLKTRLISLLVHLGHLPKPARRTTQRKLQSTM